MYIIYMGPATSIARKKKIISGENASCSSEKSVLYYIYLHKGTLGSTFENLCLLQCVVHILKSQRPSILTIQRRSRQNF